MRHQRRSHWREARWALGACFLLLGGCAVVLDFSDYHEGTAGGPGGGAGGGTGGTGGSVASSSGKGGAGGAGGAAQGGGGAGGCVNVDYTTDPENCGQCALSCLGGACAGGICQPVELAKDPGVTQYKHIVLDNASIYWSSGDGRILTLPKSTPVPAQPMEFVNVAAQADFLAIDAANVYCSSFSANGMIRAYPKQNPAGYYNIASNESQPLGLTLFQGKLSWALHGDPGTIRSATTVGAMLTDEESTLPFPFFVAADASGIYYSYRGDPITNIGGIRKVGENIPIADNQAAPSGIALDADDVYWVSFDGSVHKALKSAAGAVKDVAPPEGDIFAGEIIMDNSYIYWTGAGTKACSNQPCAACPTACGKIYRSPKGFVNMRQVFAEGEWGTLHSIAMDDKAVYWTTGDDARVFRKAKPPM